MKKIPHILCFDTATDACSVALQVGDTLFSRFEIAPRQHAKLLLPMIQAILAEAKIPLSDLDAIAFGSGPGSFMGVRLATGMAQGLAFGLSIPVIPISTLQTLAQTAYQKSKAKNMLAGWDARMNEMYVGFYGCDENGIMQTTHTDAICAPEALDINSFITVPFAIAGNAWSVYAEKCPPKLFSKATAQQTDVYPEAQAMLIIAFSKYELGDICSSENAHPHYVRHVVYTRSS